MPDFRRGAAAVQASLDAAKSRQGNGSFVRFTPSIFWTDPEKDKDNASKYIMFLNSIEDIPQVDLISYIPVKVEGRDKPYYEQAIARTDSAIGESKDPMSEEWNAQPKESHVAVAVVLEPDVEEDERGRKRPKGFRVATQEYDRKVRDDEGNATDETETVVAPIVGFVTQSPHNFFNLVTSIDAETAPIDTTALKVKRLDQKTYNIEPYDRLDVDLGDLIEYIDGVSYLSEKEHDELFEQIDAAEDDLEVAHAIGAFLLDKRMAELADEERYNKLFDGLDEPFKNFGDKKKKGKGSSKPSSRRERPARRSQRRSRDEEPAESQEAADEPQGESDAAEEKPKRAGRSPRSRAKAKDTDTPKDEAPADEKPTAAQRKDKLAALRARRAAREAAASA